MSDTRIPIFRGTTHIGFAFNSEASLLVCSGERCGTETFRKYHMLVPYSENTQPFFCEGDPSVVSEGMEGAMAIGEFAAALVKTRSIMSKLDGAIAGLQRRGKAICRLVLHARDFDTLEAETAAQGGAYQSMGPWSTYRGIPISRDFGPSMKGSVLAITHLDSLDPRQLELLSLDD